MVRNFNISTAIRRQRVNGSFKFKILTLTRYKKSKYKAKIRTGRQKLHVWSLFIARFNRSEILHKSVSALHQEKKKKKKNLKQKTYNVREIV